VVLSRYSIQQNKAETTYSKDGSYKQTEYFEKKDEIESKGGWRKIYMEIFDVYEKCNSTLENKMLAFMMKKIRNGFVLNLTYKILMDEFDVSDKKAKTFIKKMKDVGFLRGSRGIYITNPFIFVPYGMNDKSISEHQREWNTRLNK